MAAPSSLVRGTLMPPAAAARSLARTASIRRPTRDRRTLATNMRAADGDEQDEEAEGSVGVLASAVGEDAEVQAEERGPGHPGHAADARERRDFGTAPPRCAVAAATVTMASWMPRMRTAGQADQRCRRRS